MLLFAKIKFLVAKNKKWNKGKQTVNFAEQEGTGERHVVLGRGGRVDKEFGELNGGIKNNCYSKK